MSRSTFLALARQRRPVPIAADLILRRHADAEAILLDGERLGAVIVEVAREFQTPLALPIMDLKLEKARLLPSFGVPAEQADTFHFTEAPAAADIDTFAARLAAAPLPPRVAANLGALRHVARHADLIPVGMSIGPFSLATKLLSDPITPVYLAGEGMSADDEPEVGVIKAALRLSTTLVLQAVRELLDAGASAVFIAEPAANKVFFSPKQLAAGSPVFEQFALAPNRAIAALLESRGADLLFHCCGELVDAMLDGFYSLRPALLSLGSSRRLWEDAARVPADIVLYGNLPSKQFYSDSVMPEEKVAALAAELSRRMEATGHPFILGTECDTLHVEGCGDVIRAKIARLLRVG